MGTDSTKNEGGLPENNTKIKVAVIGSRGIPNNYGGFEQFAEKLGLSLKNDPTVNLSVYCSSTNPYKSEYFEGVHRITIHDPEEKLGTAGQFIYDLNSLLDARKKKFDIILVLGYTSNALWLKLLKWKSIIVLNPDGLEWKRTKFNSFTKLFLKLSEKLAINSAHFLISDSKGIQEYIKNKYAKESTFIPYGADIPEDNADASALTKFKLSPYLYDLIIARMEPENNIEMKIQGFLGSKTEYVQDTILVIVGSTKTKYGSYIFEKYHLNNHIKFVQGIYDFKALHSLRYYSRFYFHGHSVGGTNPSLLEAMAAKTFILAHDNIFNRDVLNDAGYFFKNEKELSYLIDKKFKEAKNSSIRSKAKARVKSIYSWELVCKEYKQLFIKALYAENA